MGLSLISLVIITSLVYIIISKLRKRLSVLRYPKERSCSFQSNLALNVKSCDEEIGHPLGNKSHVPHNRRKSSVPMAGEDTESGRLSEQNCAISMENLHHLAVYNSIPCVESNSYFDGGCFEDDRTKSIAVQTSPKVHTGIHSGQKKPSVNVLNANSRGCTIPSKAMRLSQGKSQYHDCKVPQLSGGQSVNTDDEVVDDCIMMPCRETNNSMYNRNELITGRSSAFHSNNVSTFLR